MASSSTAVKGMERPQVMAALDWWEMLEKEFRCDHERIEVRRRFDCIGRKSYVKQCLRCGENLGAISKRTPLGLAALRMVDFDEELRGQWSERRSARRQELWERYSPHNWYGEYLNSPQWHNRRVAILERDRYVCRFCNRRTATEVHHLTYSRLGQEKDFDLVAVCEPCHQEETERERRR